MSSHIWCACTILMLLGGTGAFGATIIHDSNHFEDFYGPGDPGGEDTGSHDASVTVDGSDSYGWAYADGFERAYVTGSLSCFS